MLRYAWSNVSAIYRNVHYGDNAAWHVSLVVHYNANLYVFGFICILVFRLVLGYVYIYSRAGAYNLASKGGKGSVWNAIVLSARYGLSVSTMALKDNCYGYVSRFVT